MIVYKRREGRLGASAGHSTVDRLIEAIKATRVLRGKTGQSWVSATLLLSGHSHTQPLRVLLMGPTLGHYLGSWKDKAAAALGGWCPVISNLWVDPTVSHGHNID